MRSREQHGLLDVVRDHHDRVAELHADLHDAVLQMRARQRVERAERLVEQQYLRLHGQRTRDADALLHAAGNLGRLLVARLRHVHELEIAQRPLVTLRLG